MTTQMFSARTNARSQALQLLFQAEILEQPVSKVLQGPFALGQDDSSNLDEPLDEYAEYLALGTDGMRAELDAVISRASTNWSVSRMPAVDRNLLRLALYEMLYVDEVAVAVTINESVEIAKAFGTDESSRFVNGLLGRVATDIENGIDVVAVACEQQRAEE